MIIVAPLLTSCIERLPPEPVPMQPPAPTLANWKPSLHLVDTALSSGAPAIALEVSDELLAKDPRNVHVLVRRGDALMALGRIFEAATSYKMAVEIDPRSSGALVGLGRVRLTQSPADAEALFVQVTVLDPHNATALDDLGVARDMQGHHVAALEAYRKAIEAAPGSVAVQVNMGLSMALSGNADDAVRILQPLAAAPDAVPRIRHNLALALALNGHKNEASIMLSHDLSPDEVRHALDGFEALRP